MPRRPELTPYQQPDGRWCLSIAASVSPTGRQIKEKFATEAEAKARARQLRAELTRQTTLPGAVETALINDAVHYNELAQMYGYDGLAQFCDEQFSRLEETRASPTLRVLVDAYLAEAAESTRQKFSYLEAALTPGLLDQSTATMDRDFWRDELAGAAKRRGWSAGSYNTYLSKLRSLYDWAVANERLKRNPIEAIQPRGGKAKAAAILTPDQLREILTRCVALDRDFSLYFAVLAFGGLRPNSEFIGQHGVCWEDVEWEEDPHLTVHQSKTKDKTGIVNRRVPLNPALRSWLAAFRQTEGRICKWSLSTCRKKRRRILTRDDGSQIVVWSDDEGSRDITRHSFGSYLASISTSDDVIRQMGHRDLKTFRRHYDNPPKPSASREYWALTYEAISQAIL